MASKRIFEQIKNFFSQAKHELSQLRDKIQAVQQEVDVLERRPIDAEAAINKLRVAIEQIGERFREDHFRTLSFVNELSPPDSLVLPFKQVDPFRLLCWLHPALVEERMTGVIETFLSESPGINPQERAEKLTELRSLLRQLELQEEELIAESSKVGLRIGRRRDADPAVVLGSES